MAYQPVTWGSEELITSTKLNQMATNQDVYRLKYVPFASLIGNPVTEPSTSFKGKGSLKFYLPAECNTLQFNAQLGTEDASATATLRIQIDGSATYQLDLTHAGTTLTIKEGTIDVTALTEGWHTLSLSLMTSSGTYAAILAAFNALLKME